MQRRVTPRVSGHKLTMTWSGERGRESISTGTCLCGWTESCGNQDEVRREYRDHLLRARRTLVSLWASLGHRKA